MNALVAQLKRWQSRERLCRLIWGFARWFGVGFAAIAIACGLDYTIDRYRDTPFSLRVAFTLAILITLIASAAKYLMRLGVPSLDVLAGRAELAFPEFGHRLVTALQLNRPTAKTEGMSKQLIHAVTTEAETLAKRHDLVQLAETSLVKRSAYIVAPIVVILTLFALFNSRLLLTLLARQCLLPLDIPRSVSIINTTPELWPSGDPVKLTFAVSGKFTPESVGVVSVVPVDQPSETYPLAFLESTADGATFATELPPSSSTFTFTARLHDGRTRKPGQVAFEPRPVVKDVDAWLLLPLYVDPEGKRRYERNQPEGEVTALPGCGLRVAASATKPMKSARVVVLSRDAKGADTPFGVPIPMTLTNDRLASECVFEIPPQAIGYRIVVNDDYDFANLNPPRRGITLAADEPPRVNLLPEVLKDPRDPGPIDDYEVTGMPLVLGGRVQIGYSARSPLGLSKAFIMYRVNDAQTWTPLPLALMSADLEKLGKFMPDMGVFENSGVLGQVEFYPIPSLNRESEPDGLEAGGRYNFETGALKKLLNGREVKLEVGDRVEFHVAVYDRNPDPTRAPGRSESRIKAVVSQSMLEDWNRQRDQSRERLKQLEERQRGVFGRGGDPKNPFRRD